MKITIGQIQSLALLMIFFINITALCHCGFAQTSSCHDKKMNKDCCCCKHNSQKKNCKDNRIVQFNQTDKQITQDISFSPLIAINVSEYFFINNKTIIKNITVFRNVVPQDASPPDFQILYQSFLI